MTYLNKPDTFYSLRVRHMTDHMSLACLLSTLLWAVCQPLLPLWWKVRVLILLQTAKVNVGVWRIFCFLLLLLLKVGSQRWCKVGRNWKREQWRQGHGIWCGSMWWCRKVSVELNGFFSAEYSQRDESVQSNWVANQCDNGVVCEGVGYYWHVMLTKRQVERVYQARPIHHDQVHMAWGCGNKAQLRKMKVKGTGTQGCLLQSPWAVGCLSLRRAPASVL